MSDGVLDAGEGMRVISNALTTLYSGEIVDITKSDDLIGQLPSIMDHVLADTPSCPFATYDESLTQFAQAIYALRVADGRCLEPGVPAGCGFYDPHHQYVNPPADEITYDGRTLLHDTSGQAYPAGIGSSFGMDFVEVLLDPAAESQSLELTFSTPDDSLGEFQVQLWELHDSGDAGSTRVVKASQVLTASEADGSLVHTIPMLDTNDVNRLGLVITRLDTHESQDDGGDYTIALTPVPVRQ